MESDNIKVVQQYLATGVSPDTKLNDYEHRPLHYARSAEMARLLIAAGADVNARDVLGNSPLFSAYRYDVAYALLNAGADPGAVNKKGATPLHSCTRPELAELLIAAGAHVNAEDEHGHTPLDYALSHNHQSTRHKQLIATLIRAGATKGSRLPDH